MGFLNDFFRDSELEFSNKADDIDEITTLHKKFLLSASLPEVIFPQFNSSKLDAIDNSYTHDDYKYLELYSTLTECIKITNWTYSSGKEVNPRYLQELYMRFTLAGILLSNMNSWNEVYKEINYHVNLNFTNIIAEADIKEESPTLFHIEITVKMFNRFGDIIHSKINKELEIDPNIFYGENPFEAYTTFDDSPKPLLVKYYETVKKLMDNFTILDNQKIMKNSKKYRWANVWLTKILALFIMKKDIDITKINGLKVKKIEYEIDTLNNVIVIDFIYSDGNGSDVRIYDNFVITNNRIIDAGVLNFVKTLILNEIPEEEK